MIAIVIRRTTAWRVMPPLIRLFLLHGGGGMLLGIAFALGLVAGNVAGLRELLVDDTQPGLVLFMLAAGFGGIFASINVGIGQ